MDIVNLNKHRKAQAKVAAKAQADANAVKFGRTKGQKTADLEATDKARRGLDGVKRDP